MRDDLKNITNNGVSEHVAGISRTGCGDFSVAKGMERSY